MIKLYVSGDEREDMLMKETILTNMIKIIEGTREDLDDPHKIGKIAITGINKVVNNMADDDNISYEKRLLFCSQLFERRKIKNVSEIIKKALNEIEDDVKTKDIDEDWLLDYFDKASCITSGMFQDLWAKILSEEIKEPNTISRRLLHNLYLMNKNDAQNFLELSRFCFYDRYEDLVHPLIYIRGHEKEYAKSRITTEILKEMEQFSLIETNYDTGFAFTNKKTLIYTNHCIVIKAPIIPAGNVRLTKDGQRLFKIIDKMNSNQILEYTISRLQYENCTVEIEKR